MFGFLRNDEDSIINNLQEDVNRLRKENYYLRKLKDSPIDSLKQAKASLMGSGLSVEEYNEARELIEDIERIFPWCLDRRK